jgi:hypothetical protein
MIRSCNLTKPIFRLAVQPPAHSLCAKVPTASRSGERDGGLIGWYCGFGVSFSGTMPSAGADPGIVRPDFLEPYFARRAVPGPTFGVGGRRECCLPPSCFLIEERISHQCLAQVRVLCRVQTNNGSGRAHFSPLKLVRRPDDASSPQCFNCRMKMAGCLVKIAQVARLLGSRFDHERDRGGREVVGVLAQLPIDRGLMFLG